MSAVDILPHEEEYVKPSSKLKSAWFYWWIQQNWKISSGEFVGRPYRFYPLYPFMEAYAKDDTMFQVVKKCAQVGITEINLAKVFALSDVLIGNIMYVLPTDDLAKTISRARLKNAILINSYLEDKLTGFDTLHQFKHKTNYIYIRGSQTQIRDGREYRRQLISIDVSRLFGDEVDEWNPGVLGHLQARIGASHDPFQSYLSVPKLPDGGITELYEKSDKKEWAIRCRKGSCREWNIGLTLEDNVTNYDNTDGEHILICRKCHEPLNRLEAEPGFAEWVATDTTRQISGFHFTKLFFRNADLDFIVERFCNPETIQLAYNDDLGEPYEPEMFSINDSVFNKCIVATREMWEQVKSRVVAKRIGVDMGKVIHYNVRGRISDDLDVILDAGRVNDFDELKSVVREHEVTCGIVDAQPDFRASLQFCEDMQDYGDFRVCYYDQSKEAGKERVLVREDNQNTFIVHVARNLGMSKVMYEMTSKKVVLPFEATYIDNGDYEKHMKSPTRVYRTNRNGQTVMVFPKATKPDHHYQAATYSKCAFELGGFGVKVGKRPSV